MQFKKKIGIKAGTKESIMDIENIYNCRWMSKVIYDPRSCIGDDHCCVEFNESYG